MKRQIVLGIGLLAAFVIFTWSLTVIDVLPAGPDGSKVGYVHVNKWIHDQTGVSWTLYHFTDWAGAAVILIPVFFAGMGMKQWIQRKSILKVDRDLLWLGAFYLAVVFAYIFFENMIINRRPVVISGVHEASYPSSTTVLSLCVMITAVRQAQMRIQKAWLRAGVCIFLSVFAASLVIIRLMSGVHWFTDIAGGILLSASLISLYFAGTEKMRGK
ncbi:MAG: phosphoesterase PA-phosphatase [Clostridia bacterium]|nr:phosphoesterase PA-phosphatase [Clostridia bacterium]